MVGLHTVNYSSVRVHAVYMSHDTRLSIFSRDVCTHCKLVYEYTLCTCMTCHMTRGKASSHVLSIHTVVVCTVYTYRTHAVYTYTSCHVILSGSKVMCIFCCNTFDNMFERIPCKKPAVKRPQPFSYFT